MLLFRKIDYINLSILPPPSMAPRRVANKRKAQPNTASGSNPQAKRRANDATPAEGNTPSGSQTPAEDIPPSTSQTSTEDLASSQQAPSRSCAGEQIVTALRKFAEELNTNLVHPINKLNKLQEHQMLMKEGKERPWYLFDVIDPAPKFCRLRRQGQKKSKQTAHVSEEGESDDFSDNPGRGKTLVSWTKDDHM